jgi:hypothetical protein
MLPVLKRENQFLSDVELNFIMPHVIEQCGHKSERHRNLYKQVLSTSAELCSQGVGRFTHMFLVSLGLHAKNKKSRVVCLEEVCVLVDKHGSSSVMSKHSIRELAECFDAKDMQTDAAARSACLDVCFSLYVAMGSDLRKLMAVSG